MNSITHKQTNLLKLIAVVFMIVDHIGAVFFSEMELFRIFGRMAMPIFVYALTIGMDNTKNRKKYILRLWLFGLLSQVPYTLLWDTKSFNILLVYCISMLLITLGKSYIGIFLLVGVVIPMEYGVYGIMIAPLLYWFRHQKHYAFMLITAVTIVYSWYYNAWFQMYSLLAFVVILYAPLERIPGINVPKRFFYWFYPVHLAILLLLKLLM